MYDTGLETFLAVARTLNISRAAAQLHLAQSTVSKRLRLLEAELGTSLVERGQGAKSLRLTPAGEEFVDIAQRLNSLWNESQRLKTKNRSLSLAIGTLDSLNFALLPPVYQSLSTHEPKISLQVITTHSPNLYDLIERREVDVAFTLLERTHPMIRVEKCYSEPMVVLRTASPDRTEHQLVHPQDLDPDHELYQTGGASYKIWHDQWWNPLHTSRVRLDTAQLVLSFLCNEQQWAIVPLSVAKMAKSKGHFHMFPLAENPPERAVYKITHKYPRANAIEGLKVLNHYFKLHLRGDR